MSRRKELLEEERRAFSEAEDSASADEETIDISRFTAQIQQPKAAAESEEAKKVAELMASIRIEEEASESGSSRPKKEKKAKKAKRNKKDKSVKKHSPFSQEQTEDEEEYDRAYNNEDAREPESFDGDEETREPAEIAEDENTYEYSRDEQEMYEQFDAAPDREPFIDDNISAQPAEEEDVLPEEEYYEEQGEYIGDIEEYQEDEPVEVYEESGREIYDDDDDETEEYENEPEEYGDEPEEYADEYSGEQNESADSADGYAEESEIQSSGSRRSLWQRIKDFWTGSEDFEEHFDDDFDPSVFDKNNGTEASNDGGSVTDTEDEQEDAADNEPDNIEEEAPEIAGEETAAEEEAENAEENEEALEDEEDFEEEIDEDAEPENDGAAEYKEDTDDEEYAEDETDSDYSAQAENEALAEEAEKKNRSIFGRLKRFWNGDDIKSRDEQVTDEEIDEEIDEEERADRSEWIKSSVKYDDLSDYAPKERPRQTEDENAEESGEYDGDETGGRKRGGVFAAMSSKVKSFLGSAVKSDEFYDEDEDASDIEDEAEIEDEDDEIEERSKKSSPIEQIKSIWNDDDSYYDEDEIDSEDELPIDAEFEEEEQRQRPVLKVINPSNIDDGDDDEDKIEDRDVEVEIGDEDDEVQIEDELEDEDDRSEAEVDDGTADDEETEISGVIEKDGGESGVSASEDESADGRDEENLEVIAEGPDAPIDLSNRTSRKKRGFISRLKGFWNGEPFGGESEKTVEPNEDEINAEDKTQEDADLHGDSVENERQTEQQETAEYETNGSDEASQSENTVSEKKTENENKAEEMGAVAAASAEEPQKAEDTATFEEISSGAVKIDEVDGSQLVNGKVIPKYVHESLVEKISLVNDDLQPIVRREYEEYIKQAKYKPKASEIVAPEVNSEVSKAVKEGIPQTEEERGQSPRPEQGKKQDKGEKRTLKDVLFGGVENSADFSEFKEQTNINQQNGQSIDDYDKPSDARAIRAEINYDNRKVSFRCIVLGVIFLITLALYIVQRYAPAVLTSNIPNSDLMTCLVSFLLLIISAVLCHSTVFGGLKPLLAFKGNSDTAAAVAAVGCMAQGIVSLFEPQTFFSGGLHLYSILAITALLLNNLGKLCIVRRIKENFKFVSSPNRKYAAKIYGDEEISKQMISKTNADKPVVALQNRTKFLKGFLRFSYMPDPSERAASFMAPITTVIAVLAAIICGIAGGSFTAAISAFSIVACMGVPMCCLLAVNIPMKKLCSDALENKAMIIGYPAVKQFADTRAVMVDSRELYPRGRVQLLAVKTFNAYNIDKALLNAAAVMKIANTPMTYMFEDVISEKCEQLPVVESVKYEDGKGIVSWVDGERLLLGNRELMAKYSINLPSVDFEESSMKSKTNCITYLANAGQLVAMLVTEYHADRKLAEELKRLENNGVTILIRTADPNVSQLKVAKDFRIFIRSIKILPTTLGNVCKDEMSRKDEGARALISTEGKLHSFARAIGGCIKIKDNITIAIIIQIIAVTLGVLIAGIVSLFAGVGGLSGLDLLLYVVFWAAASVIAPIIQRA